MSKSLMLSSSPYSPPPKGAMVKTAKPVWKLWAGEEDIGDLSLALSGVLLYVNSSEYAISDHWGRSVHQLLFNM